VDKERFISFGYDEDKDRCAVFPLKGRYRLEFAMFAMKRL